jgi:hydroxyacylglutathione hydrolase
MILECIPVGPFQENTYLLGDETTGDAVLIDPGHGAGPVLDRARALGLTVRAILNTHAHIDHVGGVAEIQRRIPVPFRLHELEMPVLQALPRQAEMFGLPPIEVPKVDGYLHGGERIPLGNLQVEVIETPGHTPGGVTFRVGDDLIVGDVLFAGSVGRTDLPGGDTATLIDSIRNRLFPLGDGCRVWSGHGPETTIGEERRTNPFVGEGAE